MLTVFQKGFISDVWLGSKCTSGCENNLTQGCYLDDDNFETKVDIQKKTLFAKVQ